MDVPPADLSPVAVTFQASADVLAILGITASGVLCVRFARRVLRGQMFAEATRRTVVLLLGTVTATWWASEFVQQLGDNLLLRDLELTGTSLRAGGDSYLPMLLVAGWGFVILLQRVFARGRRAEDHLVGVV